MRMVTMGVAVALLAGCSMKQDLAQTDAAVARFHRQLDAGDFAAIQDAAASEMKAAANAKLFVPILMAVHRKLGRVLGTERRGFNDQMNTGGHFVTVAYHTRFERGEGDENFVFKVDGVRQAVTGYNINAPALVIG